MRAAEGRALPSPPFLSLAVAPMLAAPAPAWPQSGSPPPGHHRSRTPKLRLDPELSIGRERPAEYALSWIPDLSVDASGSIYVAQPEDGGVRVFDAAGRYLRRIGHPGEGPGEFRSIGALGWVGDTLWITDPRLGRVTVVPPTSGSLRTFRLVGRGLRDYARVVPSALLSDDRAILLPNGLLTSVPEKGGPGSPIFLADRSGRVLDTLARVDVRRHRMIARTSGGGLIVSSLQPYDDTPLVRVGARGRRLVVVRREAAREAAPDSFRIDVYGPGGRPRWSRRYVYRPERVPDSVKDSLLDQAAAVYASSFRTVEEARKALRDALYLPDFAPPVTDCLVGREGSVWLRRDVFAADGTRWTVLAPDGSVRAEVRSDGPVRLLAVGPRHAWGVEYTALEVPRVVRYRLVPAQDAGG